MSEETEKQRTMPQNRSLHLWLKHLSKTLNDAGLDMKTVLKPEIDIPWDDEGVMAKKHLWKPIQEIMLDIESTADANTKGYSTVYNVLSRNLSEKLGVVPPPWPDRFRDDER